jgi:hypothetical protein
MFSLDDQQLELVTRAAALLPPQHRDTFLRSIANRVGNVATPTDHDIREAIDFILGCRIGGGSRAFIQPKPKKEVFT